MKKDGKRKSAGIPVTVFLHFFFFADKISDMTGVIRSYCCVSRYASYQLL